MPVAERTALLSRLVPPPPFALFFIAPPTSLHPPGGGGGAGEGRGGGGGGRLLRPAGKQVLFSRAAGVQQRDPVRARRVPVREREGEDDVDRPGIPPGRGAARSARREHAVPAGRARADRPGALAGGARRGA